MGRKRSSQRTDRPDEPKLNTPFDGLAKLRDQLPAGPEPAQEEPGRDHEHGGGVEASPRHPRRAVVRYERKGRGGKAATLVEKLELPADAMERWARELKATLGVGGGVEDEAIMLQGDCRERVAALLRKRGIEQISVS